MTLIERLKVEVGKLEADVGTMTLKIEKFVHEKFKMAQQNKSVDLF